MLVSGKEVAHVKFWSQLRAVALGTIGSLAVGVILCRLLGLRPEDCLCYCWAGIMGALSGMAANHVKGKVGWFSFAAGIIFAMTPQMLFLPGYLSKMGGAGAFLLCFGAQIASGWGFYGPLGVWATLLSGVSVFVGRAMGPIISWVTTACALGALLLTLDGFRDGSLRKAFHRKREHRASGATEELRRFHLLLCLGFLAMAVVAAMVSFSFVSGLIDTVKTGISHGFGGIFSIFNWLFRAIEWVIQWFSDLFPDLIDDPNPTGGGDIPEEPIYTGGPGSPLSTIIMIIIFVGICLAVTGIVASGALKARKTPKDTEESVDYVDEVERLQRPPRAPSRRKERRGKYRDITDPAMKLRFVFRKLLLAKMKDDGRTITKTPNELMDPTVQDEPELVEAYNLLRYGNRPVTEKQLEIAERYLKNNF